MRLRAQGLQVSMHIALTVVVQGVAVLRQRHQTRSVLLRKLPDGGVEGMCGQGKARTATRARAFLFAIAADGMLIRGLAALYYSSWNALTTPDGKPLPYLCPSYQGAFGTADCRFNYTSAMSLQQHNATLSLMVGDDRTSYCLRHTMPTIVGKAKGDLIVAHAVGDWRAPPGAGGRGMNATGCMPFRYNGLRSETSAEVKGDVLRAARHAYTTAQAAGARPDQYWDYLPRDLAVWAQCNQGATDVEEEAFLDVAGSDASDWEASEVLPRRRQVRCGSKVAMVPIVSPPLAAAELPPCHWYATKRRGPNTKRHYAERWEPTDTALDCNSYTLVTVCQKNLARFVNAAQDDSVLQLDPCRRCRSSGPSQPLPVPPWE
jgi:hypothetical protein